MIDEIVSDENLERAVDKVKSNKGAPGIDRMTVSEIDGYFKEHKAEIKAQILEMRYRPQPVRRVYIPKPNGKKRPLGIPVVMDRVIQQAVAQKLTEIYEPVFSDHSYGFRPGRSARDALDEVLGILNEGYEWVVDLDIEKFFDTVNHDKLISTLREKVNDKATLHLIRSFLKAGVMDEGERLPTIEGVPQGGPLSTVLANVYLDLFDRELESRGLRFVRYADDCDIFVRSGMAADRVMKSVTGWLKRKLFLTANAEKTKVVRPTNSKFLGFTFWKNKTGWRLRLAGDSKKRLEGKIKKILLRKEAVARKLADTITMLNQLVVGWMNYYKIGDVKGYLAKFGQWMRHKVRVVIFKQWKRPRTIYRNLKKYNDSFGCNMSDEQLFMVANSRLGLYRQAGMYVANYVLGPAVLEQPNKETGNPGLINPLKYYLSKVK